MEFPADVWYEILVNLPVRTLKKFQCVCKSWGFLISDLSFQKDYYNRRLQQDPLLLLVSKGYNSASGTDYLTFFTYKISEGSLVDNFSRAVSLSGLDNVESCHGLVCAYDHSEIILCNPSTRELITLPPTNRDGQTDFIGLGIAAFTKEFKVVRFFRSFDWSDYEGDLCCEVYTLGSSKWRETRPPPRYNYECSQAPFVHGALHLLAPYQWSIVAFDIESEEYTEIPLPKCYRNFTMPYLSDLEGSLCLTFQFEDRDEPKFVIELWLLKDYDSGKWIKEYTIDINSLGYVYFGVPVAIMDDGSVLLHTGHCEDEEKKSSLYCYNRRDQTFTWKTDFPISDRVILFVESF